MCNDLSRVTIGFKRKLENPKIRLRSKLSKRKERLYTELGRAMLRGGLQAAFKLCDQDARFREIKTSGYGEIANIAVAVAMIKRGYEVVLEPMIQIKEKREFRMSIDPGPYDVAYPINEEIVALLEVRLRRRGETAPPFGRVDKVYEERPLKPVMKTLVGDYGILPFGILINITPIKIKTPPYVVNIRGISMGREGIDEISEKIIEFVESCKERHIIPSSIP
ncbi:MAG: hypothetical protein DRN15_04320 [Thermoprotei archaeon]|nr:MAG: hypothetical protein DRN15_04320 [Thermoprotei archaeon]